jgi:hypothetical protein
MSGAYGGRRFQMNAWVQADENAVTVELFNDFGTGMGFLSYDGIALRLDSAYFPPELKPEYAAADFQLCFYREDALRSALRPLRLEVSREGEMETRRIWEKTRLIAEIEKLPGEIRYVNHERGYSYTIRGIFPGE